MGLLILLGPSDVEPVVVGRVGVKRSPSARSLGKVSRSIETFCRPGWRRGRRLEEVRAGVDLVRRLLAFRRLLDEAADPAVGVVDHAAEGRRVVDPDQVQDAQAAFFFDGARSWRAGRGGQDVAVQYEKRAVDVGGHVLDGAGGAERFVLDDVGDLQAQARAVAEVVLDGVGQVARRRGSPRPRRLRLSRDKRPLEEGNAEERHHRLRRSVRQRPEPRPSPPTRTTACKRPPKRKTGRVGIDYAFAIGRRCFCALVSIPASGFGSPGQMAESWGEKGCGCLVSNICSIWKDNLQLVGHSVLLRRRGGATKEVRAVSRSTLHLFESGQGRAAQIAARGAAPTAAGEAKVQLGESRHITMPAMVCGMHGGASASVVTRGTSAIRKGRAEARRTPHKGPSSAS